MAVTQAAAGAPAYAGFRVNTSANWNTTNDGMTLGSGHAVEQLLGADVKPVVEVSENTSVTLGQAAIQLPGVKIGEKVAGSIPYNANYQFIPYLIGCVFGNEAAPSGLGGGAWQHRFTPAKTVKHKFTTAWTDDLNCFDMHVCQPVGFTLEFQNAGVGKLTVLWMGKRLLTDGSGANSLASMAGVTYASQPDDRYLIANAAQLVVRINAASGAALGSGDKYYPSNLKITGMRKPMDVRTSRNAPFHDEPIYSDWMDMGLEVGFPSRTAAGDLAWMQNATELKADVTFTGSTIGSGGAWTAMFEFPSLLARTDGWQTFGNAGVLPYSYNMRAWTARSAPNGMSGVTQPRYTAISTVSSYYLGA